MKTKLLLILILLLVSCHPTPTTSPLPTPTTTSPLQTPTYAHAHASVSMNSGFEEGWHLATTFWTPYGGPYHWQYQEITPPVKWTAWWYEGFLCSDHPSLQGRPEVRVISTTPDPVRIHSGDQAVKWATFWYCHRGGLYQQISVEPGKHYTAQAFGHTWFSECSTRPHSRPFEKDCTTPLTWARLKLRVCLDPLGGTDPGASSVVCSFWKEVYGGYGTSLRLERVEAISSTMTIFTESNASHPLKHDDVYWDDVTLSESYQVFLPYVAKEE